MVSGRSTSVSGRSTLVSEMSTLVSGRSTSVRKVYHDVRKVYHTTKIPKDPPSSIPQIPRPTDRRWRTNKQRTTNNEQHPKYKATPDLQSMVEFEIWSSAILIVKTPLVRNANLLFLSNSFFSFCFEPHESHGTYAAGFTFLLHQEGPKKPQ